MKKLDHRAQKIIDEADKENLLSVSADNMFP